MGIYSSKNKPFCNHHLFCWIYTHDNFRGIWVGMNVDIKTCVRLYRAIFGIKNRSNVILTCIDDIISKVFFKYSRDYIETYVYCYAIFINSRIIELPKTEKILSDCNKVNEQYISYRQALLNWENSGLAIVDLKRNL